MKELSAQKLRGSAFAMAVGLLAYAIAEWAGGLSAVMLALLMGIALGNTWKCPPSLKSGLSWSSFRYLEWSVVFLGFEVTVQHITKLGSTAFLALGVMVLLILVLTTWLSKYTRCPKHTALLIGFGTSICGSSAIAAAAPKLASDKTDVGIALAVVNLIGAMGMIAAPFVLPVFFDSAIQLGFFTGASLHAVANVAGAAFSMDDLSGDYALTVKMARVALLSPALIIFGFILRGKDTEDGPWYKHLNLPLYLWFFVGASALSSLGWIPELGLLIFHNLGKILLSAAMFAIGMKLSISHLYKEGRTAMGFGLLMFLLQLVVVSGLCLML